MNDQYALLCIIPILVSEEIEKWRPEPGDGWGPWGPWGPWGLERDVFSSTDWRGDRAADGESDGNEVPGAPLSPRDRPLLIGPMFSSVFRAMKMMSDFKFVFISILM